MNDANKDTGSQKMTALGLTRAEVTRTTVLLGMELFFLMMSPLSGGFNNKVWSILDSAILVLAIGVTSLIYILESPEYRRIALYTAMTLYILGIIDMSLNILITGWIGWANF